LLATRRRCRPIRLHPGGRAPPPPNRRLIDLRRKCALLPTTIRRNSHTRGARGGSPGFPQGGYRIACQQIKVVLRASIEPFLPPGDSRGSTSALRRGGDGEGEHGENRRASGVFSAICITSAGRRGRTVRRRTTGDVRRGTRFWLFGGASCSGRCSAAGFSGNAAAAESLPES